MEKINEENKHINSFESLELREWESPKLYTEDMESITEGGVFPGGGNVDDGFYKS